MGEFNASAEAEKIATMAKGTLGDYSAGKGTATHADLEALATELKSFWSEKPKVSAVAAELEKVGDRTFSALPNVSIQYPDGNDDTPHIVMSGSNWSYFAQDIPALEVSSQGGALSLDLWLSDSRYPQMRYNTALDK